VAFLGLLALFVFLTYAVFNKMFSQFTDVTLQASRTGLELPTNADIKIRGVEVGIVRGTQVTAKGVDITLALYPDKTHIIPSNVTARILPKTLFGEKYVALQVPAHPSPRSIQAGAVITETKVSIEVQKVLADIYPLLRTVQPAQLNYTLTAMADALQGRGTEIGHSIEVLDSYLGRMNPKLHLLIDDLKKLSSVSDTYAAVTPELANLLRNSVKTGHTFLTEHAKVKALFDQVASFSNTSHDFLQRNGSNIIRLSKQGQAQLPLYAKYSPEYPCLLRGLVGLIPREAQAFRGHTLHIDLETLPRQPRGWNPSDSPEYADHRGVSPGLVRECNAAVNGRWGQSNLPPRSLDPRIHDGVNYPYGKRPPTAFDVSSGYSGTAAERSVVDGIAAPVMGVPASDVPDVATLLFAPLARGTEVSLR
jgi:phospholipid/cholesterol/gamma-HCH transport system substrate-binding protein